MKKIYLDYASTTPVDPIVLKVMLPYFSLNFENSSALYSGALRAKSAMNKAREDVAKFLSCEPEEIIFTSGGTESDNLAIFGALKKFKKGHIITTAIEHPAVLNPIQQLEKNGFEVTYLKPDSSGIIKAKQVKEALRADTLLISIMYANNEIGTIQPIAEIAKMVRKNKDGYPLFHIDACQATGYLDMNIKKLGVDLLTLNGSKIYAPKGIGILYIKKGSKIEPLMLGGGQEMLMRAGTENIAFYVGLAKALEIVSPEEVNREAKMRDYLIEQLLKIDGVKLNGSAKKRLPNNVNVSVKGVEGESIVLYLDRKGIEIATGSACSSKSLEPSRIIMAIADEETAHSSLRITLGRFTKKAELDIFLKEFKSSVLKLREMSAL